VRASDPPPLAGMAMIAFRHSRLSRRGGDAAAAVRHRDSEASAARTRRGSGAARKCALHEELQANENCNPPTRSCIDQRGAYQPAEMQSMNILQVVNVELQSKIADLELAQSDMRNLLNSTDIATLFLDRDLNVRRFTERARKIISLRDSDVGRPLSDLTTHLEYPGLQSDVRDMLRTLVVSEKQIRGGEGQWFTVRVMPYRTHDDVIDGAVITFVDITAAKELEARLRGA
jgi:PAS domain-containing protein